MADKEEKKDLNTAAAMITRALVCSGGESGSIQVYSDGYLMTITVEKAEDAE